VQHFLIGMNFLPSTMDLDIRVVLIDHRYRGGGHGGAWSEPPCTMAVSSTEINVIGDSVATSALYDLSDGSKPAANITSQSIEVPAIYPHLPMLASQCPGWVCYAEKSQPKALPYISTTKSAQQILGTTLRHVLAEQHASSGAAGTWTVERSRDGSTSTSY
jgi:Iron only hydrogenase large subunit, C-terminal domain